jgi:iron(III) transport system substrate-binding protein
MVCGRLARSISAVAIGTALVAGCSAGGNAPAPSGPFGATADEACTAAAKESGAVNYVASTDAAVFAKEIEAFKAKYPDIAVSYTNLRSQDASQRLLAESQVGRGLSFDALAGELPGFQPLFDEDLVLKVDWPKLGLGEDLVIEQGQANAFRNYRLVTGLGYNTNLVKPEELPTTWAELVNPKWAGKVIVDPRGQYLGTMAPGVGQQETIDWFKKFSDVDKPLIIQGATASAQKVISGEALLTTSAADANIRESQAAGAPIGIKYLDFVPTSDYYTLVMKDTPRPNKTACFLAWMGGPEGRAQKEKYEFQKNESKPADLPPGSTLVLTDTPEARKTSADTSDALAKIMAG